MIEKITFFEVHLDDARFGTNDTVNEDVEAVVADEDHVEAVVAAPDDSSGVARLLVASLFVSVGAALLARRLFGDDADDAEPIELDTTDDATAVEIEQ